MTIVIFVRHGQSESNLAKMLTSDPNSNPLSPLGVSQAESMANELKKLQKVDAVFTSPVLRARQTAEIIAKGLYIAPKIDTSLRERGFGNFENKRFASSEEMIDFMLDEIRFGYGKGMESWSALKERIWDFIAGLEEDTVSVAVTHLDPILVALALLDGKFDGDITPANGIRIATGSATILDLRKKRIVAIGTDKVQNGL